MGVEILEDRDELIRRLQSRTFIDPETGCWLWQGALNNVIHGHGIMRLWKGSPKFYTHRLSAYIYHGYDLNDKGNQVNHYCSNQHCWNPLHIYAGTQVDNMQDAVKAGTHYEGKYRDVTHCIRGHEFTPENTYTWYRDGKPERQCRECNRVRQQEYIMRMKGDE